MFLQVSILPVWSFKTNLFYGCSLYGFIWHGDESSEIIIYVLKQSTPRSETFVYLHFIGFKLCAILRFVL